MCLIGKVEKGIVSKGNCRENDESIVKNGGFSCKSCLDLEFYWWVFLEGEFGEKEDIVEEGFWVI